MEREILNYQFSIFGKYDGLYFNINREVETDKFSLFDKELTTDLFPDGKTMNCYILSNKDVRIAIHYNRIDFIFRKMDKNDCIKFQEYYSLFSNQIEFINRLAINFNFFFKDDDCELMNKFSSLVKIFDGFGKATEFSYRTNQVFVHDDIEFNDIVTIQNGNVQKHNSFEANRALIFMCDINTAIGKTNNIRFNLNKLDVVFEIMFERLSQKIISANSIVEK